MKKILVLLLLVISLFGCSKKEDTNNTVDTNDDKYIKPAIVVNYVDYLNYDLKTLFQSLQTREDGITNKDVSRLGKSLIDITTTDYYGNEIDFNDFKDKKIVLEVVAEWCNNCQSQSKTFSDKLIESLPDDVEFVQYFNVGNTQQIEEFYKEIDKEVPSNITILPENEEIKNYLVNDLKLEYYPTFLFFDNGILTWSTWGELSAQNYSRVEDTAFNNHIDLGKLVDNNGESIFNNGRSTDDVAADLSDINKEKLKAIDSDGKDASYNTTLNVIGRTVDYSKINEIDLEDTPLIEDYLKYQNEDTIVFFTVLDSEVQNDYQIINQIISDNPSYKYIVLLKEGTDNVTYNNEIIGAEVSMSKANVPADLLDLKIERIPTAIFVEKGVITGGIAAIDNAEKVTNNISLFFGDGAIALTKNN